MSTIDTGSRTISARGTTSNLGAKLIASAVILIVTVSFVLKYVFRYYFHYNAAAFTDPVLGAPNYCAMRGWLLMHITGGMVALLIGSWQFWTGFRLRYAPLHRRMVRAYVVTSAFVRLLNDYYLGARPPPAGDRAITIGWGHAGCFPYFSLKASSKCEAYSHRA
jgi:hypothetical protein